VAHVHRCHAALAIAMDGCLRCTVCCAHSTERGTRCASHAGSWYPSDPSNLRAELQFHLDAVQQSVALDQSHRFLLGRQSVAPKALIVPHAGLRFCGDTAAHAYARLVPSSVQRIVVLGPLHHKRIQGCALPVEGTSAYETPVGDIPLDTEALDKLRRTGDFMELDTADDETEHSIEMQLPFLALRMAEANAPGRSACCLLPVFVGRLQPEALPMYAKHLSPYLQDPATMFVISSDFCHWGAKFGYVPFLESSGPPHLQLRAVPGMGCAPEANPINACIEALDQRAIDLICRQDSNGFRKYLEKEGNTICGRNAISIFLELLGAHRGKFRVSFVHYSQSRMLGQFPAEEDSSVSYAAGICEPLVSEEPTYLYF